MLKDTGLSSALYSARTEISQRTVLHYVLPQRRLKFRTMYSIRWVLFVRTAINGIYVGKRQCL
jgi:hypothetical protein